MKISRNTTTKHFGVIFTCINSRAVHLKLAVDYSTYAETILCHQRTTCADDGSQLVGAEGELREIIQGWNHKELKEFSAEK